MSTNNSGETGTGIPAKNAPVDAQDSGARDDAAPMPFTGERYVPELLGETRQEHVHRYAWVREAVRDKDVVDVACGEGFGSAFLSRSARSVTGVDISEEAINHATARYGGAMVRFVCADAASIPLPDASADVVISFETIEHVNDQDRMMSEIARILRPGGFLIISSPNVAIYSDKQQYHNDFHVKELDIVEFKSLLYRHFSFLDIYGQRLSVTSSILPSDTDDGRPEILRDEQRDVAPSVRDLPDTMYFVAVAANDSAHLPVLTPSVLFSADYDNYWSMREHIQNLTRDLSETRRDYHKLKYGDEARIALSSSLFSRSYYNEAAGLDLQDDTTAVIHYFVHGEPAGLRPSIYFDPKYYLANNLDVGSSEISPLVHFLKFGQYEGRRPCAPPASYRDEAPSSAE